MDSMTSFSGIYSASCSSYCSKEWAISTPITLALQDQLKKGHFVDAHFRMQNQDIFAHKLVCAIWSPLLADKFYGEQKEEGIIVVDNVSPKIFNVLIQFMYGSKIEIYKKKTDIDFILSVYKAAVEFDVPNLKKETKTILLDMTENKHNVFHLLEASKVIGSEAQESKCMQVLQTQTSQVLASYDLVNVTPQMLQVILGLPHVSFESEYEVVLWCLAWAKNRSVDKQNTKSLKDILSGILPYIELTALTTEQFCDLFLKHTDIMTEAEGFQILMNIHLKDQSGSYPLPEWCTRVNRTYGLQDRRST